MINLSSHHFGNGTVLRVVEHDWGINLRNSLFSRTCWVMFLAFPLDFRPGKYCSKLLDSLVQLSLGQITPSFGPESYSDAELLLLAGSLEALSSLKAVR
jgi:hypothetical protein